MEDFKIDSAYFESLAEYLEFTNSQSLKGADQISLFKGLLERHLSRYSSEVKTNGNDSELAKILKEQGKKIKGYLGKLEWFHRYGYEPKTKIHLFDFEEYKEQIREFTLEQKLELWRKSINEINTFCTLEHLNSDDDFLYAQKYERGKASYIAQANDEILKLSSAIPSKTSDNSNKIVWLRKPSEFGFIFKELIDKGYIADPSGNKESPKAIAEAFLDNFAFANGTTIGTLTKEFSEKGQTLTDKNRDKIQIPNAIELDPILPKGKK